jgi:hypothetical protein
VQVGAIHGSFTYVINARCIEADRAQLIVKIGGRTVAGSSRTCGGILGLRCRILSRRSDLACCEREYQPADGANFSHYVGHLPTLATVF